MKIYEPLWDTATLGLAHSESHCFLIFLADVAIVGRVVFWGIYDVWKTFYSFFEGDWIKKGNFTCFKDFFAPHPLCSIDDRKTAEPAPYTVGADCQF